MTPENNDALNDQHDQLKGDEKSREKLVNARLSDAASENARESERVQEAARAAVPAYELNLEDQKPPEKPVTTAKSVEVTPQDKERQKPEQETTPTQPLKQPASTPDRTGETDENLSGSTNLSLDQLKKERDPGGFNTEVRDTEP